MDDRPITDESRARLLDLLKETRSGFEPTFNRTVEMRRTLESLQIPHDAAILNVIEFALLLKFDLSCLLCEMIDDDSALRSNLYARLQILTVHESCLTLKSLLAKKFRTEMIVALGALADDSVLRKVHSDVCHLFEKSSREFGDVRDGIVAHRDADPEARVQLLEKADVRAVTDLVIEMLRILESVLRTLLPYLAELNDRLAKRSNRT